MESVLGQGKALGRYSCVESALGQGKASVVSTKVMDCLPAHNMGYISLQWLHRRKLMQTVTMGIMSQL